MNSLFSVPDLPFLWISRKHASVWGMDFHAIVNDQDGLSFAISQEKVIGLADLSDAMLSHPMVFELLSRRGALVQHVFIP